jgi:hypothetical protein
MIVTAARDHRWGAAGYVIVQVVVCWLGCGLHQWLLLV